MNTELVTLTEELVRMKTTADRASDLHGVVDFAKQFFAKSTNVCVKEYESGGKPSVVFSTEDTLSPDILLVGHLDVVPAAEAQYTPTIEGAQMKGRGVCDMKSEDAVMMLLMREYAARAARPNIALMLTTDEEIGGAHGAGHLVRNIGYRSRVAFVPDTGQAPEELTFCNKGVLSLTVTAHGKSAHGSRPWLGTNAIEQLMDAVGRILKIFPATEDPDHWYTTANVGVVTGGTAGNVVPDLASCEINIRYTPDKNRDDIVRAVQAVAAPCEVQVTLFGDASATDPADPFVQEYVKALARDMQMTARFIKGHGANDGRFFTALGIPAIVSRPTSGAQHSPDEWVDLNSLCSFMNLYRNTIDAVHEKIVGLQ